MGKMISGLLSLFAAFIFLNGFNQQASFVTEGTAPLFFLGMFLIVLAGTRKTPEKTVRDPGKMQTGPNRA